MYVCMYACVAGVPLIWSSNTIWADSVLIHLSILFFLVTFPAPRTVCTQVTFAGEHLHHVSLRLFQFLSCSHILYSHVIFSIFAQGQ